MSSSSSSQKMATNIRWRGATLVDIKQVCEIGNFHIANSCCTLETTPLPVSYYEEKLRDLNARGLPFFVLVTDLDKWIDGSNLILGYCYLSPFGGHLLSYASTVQLSIYICQSYMKTDVGHRFLEEVLILVAFGKVMHNCVERVGDIARIGAGSALGLVNQSPLYNIIAIVAVDPKDPDEGNRLKDMLLSLKFVEKGRMEKVAMKKGRL
jgi:phosphinothricin acetyltransferase